MKQITEIVILHVAVRERGEQIIDIAILHVVVRERGKINHRYCYTSSGCQRERGKQITVLLKQKC